MKDLRLTTPKKVTKCIINLAATLQLDTQKTVFLKFKRPTDFEPALNECHINVLIQQKRHGGGVQYGWIFFKDQNHPFYEAIFHAVWRNKDDQLIDVTPRVDMEKRLMFMPDFQRKAIFTEYENQPAIHTFTNAKAIDTTVIELTSEITAVPPSDFPIKHGVWPWQTGRVSS